MNTEGYNPYDHAPARPADPARPAPTPEQRREAEQILRCYETVLTLADAARANA